MLNFEEPPLKQRISVSRPKQGSVSATQCHQSIIFSSTTHCFISQVVHSTAQSGLRSHQAGQVGDGGRVEVGLALLLLLLALLLVAHDHLGRTLFSNISKY